MRALAAILIFTGITYAQDVVLPDGKAKAIIEQACTECHGLDSIVTVAQSADQWRQTVKTMVKRGASLTPQDIDTVVDYLSVYFADTKINVNKASAEDLQNGLAITAAEATAIVDFRKAHGDFKDLEALHKVTGVDPKKIDQKKDQIVF